MRLSVFLLLLSLLAGPAVRAQSPAGDAAAPWTLERCVDYAMAHNISLQQAVLNNRLAQLNEKQAQLSRLPNANASIGYGRSYGRSVDPTTNSFVQGSYDFLSLGGNADVLLFGWFARRRQIEQSGLLRQATAADAEQLANDVSLNVATGFLRALLARAQIGSAKSQLSLSLEQLRQTRGFATAGRVPELNVAQLESQVATDSSALISAEADYTASLLDLRALLNLDFEAPFDIAAPADSSVNDAELLGNSPDDVFVKALDRFGGVRSAALRIRAAEQGSLAAKAARLPQLSFSVQAGSNYATTFKDYSNPVVTGTQNTGAFVDIAGTPTPIYQPAFSFTTTTTPLGRQVGDNFRHTYSLNLTVPIFNGWSATAAWRRAQIDVLSQNLNRNNAELKLKQDIYKAWNDARNAYAKLRAADRAADAARRAQVFAKKRYELGLINTVEYLTIQNTQYRSDVAANTARYDAIFRMKVIDYYLGKPLRL